ncbi:MAG: hypothetical protein WCT39_02090 [Candidatus Margulisiibacteriota bacterium]
MPKLVKLLKENKMTLIVEVPANDPAVMEAAALAGADALQLKGVPRKMIEGIALPVGVLIEGKTAKNEKDVKTIVKMGFDFINVDADAFGDHIAGLKGVSKVLALGSKFSVDKLIGISSLQGAALDAAIIPTGDWGKELVVGDLQNYISIILSANIPVIIPTQRAVRTSEVAIIADTGAKAILLTETVMGNTPAQVEKTVREFRLAIDELE